MTYFEQILEVVKDKMPKEEFFKIYNASFDDEDENNKILEDPEKMLRLDICLWHIIQLIRKREKNIVEKKPNIEKQNNKKMQTGAKMTCIDKAL